MVPAQNTTMPPRLTTRQDTGNVDSPGCSNTLSTLLPLPVMSQIAGRKDVDTVFEHPGEQTFPVSCLVVKRGGMVVFCAGTTGFNLTFDARYVWMRQKRIQGSHFAHLKQAVAANKFVLDRRIDPCMSEVFPWSKIPPAHTKMWNNQHAPGNMAVLVNAPRAGLKTLEDAVAG